MELDRISNLPDDLKEKILLLLPLNDAARTSVLSNDWRYRWSMIPQLVFDGLDASIEGSISIAEIVNAVLLLHRGSINKFKLSNQSGLHHCQIDRWISHLSGHSIKYFILEVTSYMRSYYYADQHCYRIPSCFFSWQHLIQLKLRRCCLNPPPAFRGFRRLKKLDFIQVSLSQDVIDNLIVSCPLLVGLFLTRCDGFGHLKIDAPNLYILGFRGVLQYIILRNAISLNVVNISSTTDVVHTRIPGSSSNLAMFFLQLPRVRILTIKSYFLKYLTVGELPRELPVPCLHLIRLSIEIRFNDPKEIVTVLCLLRSSPALQELKILVWPEDPVIIEEDNSWFDDNLIGSFPELQLVAITSISGSNAELDFIKILLLGSPDLKTMTIKPASAEDSTELLRKLLRCRRASVHAEVIYMDP